MPTTKRPTSKTPRSSLKEASAKLIRENKELKRERNEALEQQTATSEILRVIASSPTDIQPVLDVVAENAARLCDASDAQILRVDADILRLIASYGSLPTSVIRPINRQIASGRAVIDRQTIHVHDLAAAADEYPESTYRGVARGVRTQLVTPLLRERLPIGAILIRRVEVRPFSEKQIALLKTFADQAVIAIENVRLFQELQGRNRDLTEALEQQTATSEILSVISSSPTDVQPVFDTIVKNAARLCEGSGASVVRYDGEMFYLVAQYNISEEIRDAMQRMFPTPPTRQFGMTRSVLDSTVIHIPDVRQDAEYRQDDVRAAEVRAVLAAPLLRDGRPIGAIGVNRSYPGSFTDNQIALLKTFADQAVIAIENVRLFKELQDRNRDLTEALEQQTATSEILRVIASSPTDLQPVLDVVVKNAARLCGTPDANIMQVDGDILRVVAAVSESVPGSPVGFERPLDRDSGHGRAVIEGRTIHIPDFLEVAAEFPQSRALQTGYRTMLAIPLVREGVPIGVIGLRRNIVQPFTDNQIALVKTFADQAVIAIENVRLFQELKEALEQQTATTEILGVIASSPTDIQPVLNVVAQNAARLCDSNDAQLRLIDGSVLRLSASYGPLPVPEIIPISRQTVSGRAVTDRQMIHVHDLEPERETEYPEAARDGSRTILGMPLLREGIPIGVILIRRLDVRPFSDKQIKLLETFADQAVIAIENVRLFKEFRNAIATSPKRWNSKRQPARFCASLPARRPTSNPYWIRSLKTLRGCVRLKTRRSFAPRVRKFDSSLIMAMLPQPR